MHAPNTRFKSIVVEVGISSFDPNKGLFRTLIMKLNVIKLNPTAETMTNIKDAIIYN